MNSPVYRLRDYEPADAAALLALFRETIRRVNCRDYCPAQIAAWSSEDLTLETWAKNFGGKRTFVAEVADKAHGTIAGFGDLEPSGHLDRFFVSADHQGQGVGRLILSAIVAQARQWNCERIFTEASITARPFFMHFGFRELRNQIVFFRGAAFLNYCLELPIPA
ncbi:putative N-acetyltransferase YafP [Anatilimnocola aggregata]|uniref:Putative N-acetyltransferase YafP n=1 Tax=Anatilimnocola aggregata TaxID=2528021 RepID=A0A517Y9M2_9BACT|nr:GNAT family N-acetyltransferase [Anatilimnocola aggregata]QDU26935.1 putative N-acetyltransferase YafP [Anatilimnocola aggregata]